MSAELVQDHTSTQWAYLKFVLPETADFTLKVVFCNCFHFHKVKWCLKGAEDKVKVLLKIEVYQNFKMKPKNYTEGLSTATNHWESVVEVFDCLIKYEIELLISSVSGKCLQMYLTPYCYMKSCS